MKTERNILITFFLNLAFSVFEFIGGYLIGSVTILSDAIHDAGDAMSIGISFFLEKKSRRQPDEQYTYGYARYSVIGSVVTTLILLLGSCVVICNASRRIFLPTPIDYNGMILFAVVGVMINSCAAFLTRKGDSLNQKAVNLHMLEDVLSWGAVLIGALIMRRTGLSIIDPLMSIGFAVFLWISAIRILKDALELFLEKTPHGIDLHEIKACICEIEDVIGVHDIHIWSLDGRRHYATMHIVTRGTPCEIKEKIRKALREHLIWHATLELETEDECPCREICQQSPHPLSTRQ